MDQKSWCHPRAAFSAGKTLLQVEAACRLSIYLLGSMMMLKGIRAMMVWAQASGYS